MVNGFSKFKLLRSRAFVHYKFPDNVPVTGCCTSWVILHNGVHKTLNALAVLTLLLIYSYMMNLYMDPLFIFSLVRSTFSRSFAFAMCLRRFVQTGCLFAFLGVGGRVSEWSGRPCGGGETSRGGSQIISDIYWVLLVRVRRSCGVCPFSY